MKTLNKEQFESLRTFWEQYSKYYSSGFYRTFNTVEEATEWLASYTNNPDDKVCRLVFVIANDKAFLGVHHVYANSGKTKSEVFELTDGKKLLVEDYDYKDADSVRRVF